MKAFYSILTLVLAVVGLAGSAFAQSQYDIQRVTDEVMKKGIAVHNPAVEATYLEDFIDSVGVVRNWTVTVNGTSSFFRTHRDTLGIGVVEARLDTTGGAGQSDLNAQHIAHVWQLIKQKPLTFESLMITGVVGSHEYTVGLSQKSTTACDSVVKGIAFTCIGDSALLFVVNRGVTQNADTTDTGITLADSTAYRLGFRWDGANQITAYINGAVVATVTGSTARPDSIGMAPTLGFRQTGLAGIANMAGLTNQRLWLDYVYIKADR